jgi:hypothetical protein
MDEAPAAQAPAGRRRHGSGVPVTVRSAGRVPEPPLRAGPVLSGDWGWPW